LLAGIVMLFFPALSCTGSITGKQAAISPTQPRIFTPLGSYNWSNTITPSETNTNHPSSELLSPVYTLSPSLVVTLTSTINPLACVPSDGEIEYGLVKWITDGDTIVVDISGQLRTVQYLGIDAPEYFGMTEYRGPTATRFNEELVENQLVRLVRDGIDKDSAGQLLRYVFIENVFVNYELVRQGLANTIIGVHPFDCEKTFLQAEELAEQEVLGIWKATRTPHSTALSTKSSTAATPPLTPLSVTSTSTFTATLTMTPIQTSTLTVTLTPTVTPSMTFTVSPSPEITATNTLTTTGYLQQVALKEQ
jgi:endonuclease YncB( thermonuclease family)